MSDHAKPSLHIRSSLPDLSSCYELLTVREKKFERECFLLSYLFVDSFIGLSRREADLELRALELAFKR